MHNTNSYSWVKNYPGEITMHAKMLVEDPALKTFYYLNKYDAHVFAEMFPPFSWCSETTGWYHAAKVFKPDKGKVSYIVLKISENATLGVKSC